jgi:lysozyme family protein
MRESDFNFDTYLGNGDPLRNHNGKQIRTIHVPAGRGPFFSWESGARDAIIYDHLDQLKPPTDHWDIVTCLMRSEEFNGLGYRSQGRRSPYVWSFTNIYQGGKYIADHKYSAAAWDHQCGVAAMWLALKLNHGIDLNEV